MTVRPVDKLDGDAGFAEVFFDDVFVPDADVLGEVNKGWEVAMATTGSERGLSLRSPGRFMAVVDRLIDLYRERPDPSLHDEVADGWMAAQAYKLATDMTVTRLVDGAEAGRRVEPEQGVLVGDGHRAARDRAAPARRGRRSRARGSRATSSRSPGRSTRAPTRSSATSSPSDLLGLPRK